MGERLRRVPGRLGRWVVHKRAGRLITGVLIWTLILVGFSFVVDRDVWIAFGLGVLCPVSLWWAFQGHWLPRRTHLETLLQMTPRQFERAVADLLHPLGFREIRVVGGPRDTGVDVLCRDEAGSVVAIQCKRYQPDRNISSRAVQTFMGGMVHYKAQKGIIVTTSEFSTPARALATKHDIRIIDGAELTRLMHQHNQPSTS